MHSLMSASVCLYVLVCVYVFFCCHCYCCSWLHVCVLRFVEVARIGLPPAIYLGPPSPTFPSLPLSVYLPLYLSRFFQLCCAIFVHTIAVFLLFFLRLPFSLLAWFVLRILYIPLRNSFIAAQHRLLFLLPALLLALRLDVNRIFIR